MDLHILDTSTVAFATAQKINYYLREANIKHLSTLLMLSGGSGFQVLPHLETSLFSRLITISVLDERFSSDHQINNCSILLSTEFFNRIKNSISKLIDTRPLSKETNPRQLAFRWELELRAWKQNYPHGQIVILQGIGADGHTCGILPFPENSPLFWEMFEKDKEWIVGYDAGDKNPYPLRVTPTNYFLKQQVDKSIIYATGKSKKPILKKVISNQGGVSEIPALILHQMKHIDVFTDQAV